MWQAGCETMLTSVGPPVEVDAEVEAPADVPASGEVDTPLCLET